MEVLWFTVGVAVGAAVVWLALRVRSTATRVALETKLKASEEAQAKLSQTFDSLAGAALRNNTESFLQLAKQSLETRLTQAQGDFDQRKQAVEALVKPLQETLSKIEQERQTAYGGFKQMTETMVAAQKQLALETRHLSTALRAPQVRGRWGESTLHRVAELTGMVERCDFEEQTSIDGDGSIKRPDMIVLLPNERRIVVDSKTPLDAYLRAVEAVDDEARSKALEQHARQVRDRFMELSGKAYWASLGCTPEFVVLFLPGEPFLSAALQQDPTLLDDAMVKKVVLATPASLFCLLNAVGLGWREEKLSENAREISQRGREIHDRIADWVGHLDRLGGHLDKAVDSYNKAVGSLEQRVLVSARRFKEFGVASDKDITVLPTADVNVRQIQKIEGSPPSSGQE
jgi:DNA recombination protein RmuC